ncbi:zinc ribbon domain-containing protein [Gluconobacter sp. OJB]|uniref:zinc ribbon domain-containing protein n=1 Tax=Gluconobacter sp. OJB TaxID=3145196 RepID=UPI0038CFD753
MFFLIIVIILGCIVGIIANSKGRSFFPWFIYGMALFIVAIVHVLCIKSIDNTPIGPASHTKKCPQCAETVQADARICRFCRYDFEGAGNHTQPAQATIPPQLPS